MRFTVGDLVLITSEPYGHRFPPEMDFAGKVGEVIDIIYEIEYVVKCNSIEYGYTHHQLTEPTKANLLAYKLGAYDETKTKVV